MKFTKNNKSLRYEQPLRIYQSLLHILENISIFHREKTNPITIAKKYQII